ncbi:MAG: hypothetical protein FJ304_16720 [Planctomycetes bacterium]|nr:hypothetical protein [Planctomycetota bacterium]
MDRAITQENDPDDPQDQVDTVKIDDLDDLKHDERVRVTAPPTAAEEFGTSNDCEDSPNHTEVQARPNTTGERSEDAEEQ